MSAIEQAVKKVGTQQALAEKIGVTQSLISQWVKGAPIDVGHFRKICEATDGDITPEMLLADEMKRAEARRTGNRRRRAG